MTDRAVVSFVTEPHGEWIERSERLAMTLADSVPPSVSRVVLVVDGLEGAARRRLEALGCTVRSTSAVDPSLRFLNKLRMLELREIDDTDGVLCLDCDVVVLGDPLPLIDRRRINAYVEQGTNLSDGLWSRVHDRCGLPPPVRGLRDELTGQPRYPYFNTGVLWVPAHLNEPLRAAWTTASRELIEMSTSDHELCARRGLIDQIAFSVAILRLEAAVATLPLALNCPTGGFRWGARPALQRPLILHYHRNVDDRGFLRVPNHPLLRREIDGINRRWSEHRGIAYTGAQRQPLKKRLIRGSRITQRILQSLSQARQWRPRSLMKRR